MTVTNAMRLLTQAGIRFETAEYPVDESDLSGVHAAAMGDKGGDDPCQGAPGPDGLCTRRLLPHRHEEEISHLYR